MESLLPFRDGLHDHGERRAAGLMLGSLWVVGGISGALWYLVPGAYMAHWQIGLVTASFSGLLGVLLLLAPWRRLSPRWLYPAVWLSLPLITFVMAVNGGSDSPTVLYLFLCAVLVGYYFPARHALVFLLTGLLVPASPLLYDDRAGAAYVAELALTAPIYAAVGLVVVLAKRQLVVLRDRSRDQALRDSLTGLYNRRALTHALREAVEGRRRGEAVALMMVDLDDFKAINTLHGHGAGDEVLRSAAAALRRVTRSGDLLARLGGDEFALLIPAATEHELDALSARVVEALHSAAADPRLPGGGLTGSVGYVIHPGGPAGIDELLAGADAGMRAAKRAGKNRWHAGEASTSSRALDRPSVSRRVSTPA